MLGQLGTRLGKMSAGSFSNVLLHRQKELQREQLNLMQAKLADQEERARQNLAAALAKAAASSPTKLLYKAMATCWLVRPTPLC